MARNLINYCALLKRRRHLTNYANFALHKKALYKTLCNKTLTNCDSFAFRIVYWASLYDVLITFNIDHSVNTLNSSLSPFLSLLFLTIWMLLLSLCDVYANKIVLESIFSSWNSVFHDCLTKLIRQFTNKRVSANKWICNRQQLSRVSITLSIY